MAKKALSIQTGFRLIRPGLLLVGATAAFLAVSVPVRADDDDDEDSQSWSDKIGDSIKNTFTGAGKAIGLGSKPEGPPPPESPSGCPTIAILDGTAGQRVMAAGASGNQGVRYQFSLTTVGRQCTIAGSRVAIRVAAGGRVLLGPAGSPGRFDIPVRVVVYNELKQTSATSKLYKVPAAVGAGQSSAPFQFMSDDITVPLTYNNAASEYSIKVGLDAGKGGGDTGAAKKTSHRRRKPVSTASE